MLQNLMSRWVNMLRNFMTKVGQYAPELGSKVIEKWSSLFNKCDLKWVSMRQNDREKCYEILTVLTVFGWVSMLQCIQ
jgi:hypothetical protein